MFLASRGNLREVEKHLGVSYPTARARFASLLRTLGLAEEPEPTPGLTRDQILAEVASGALSPAEATELLRTARLTLITWAGGYPALPHASPPAVSDACLVGGSG